MRPQVTTGDTSIVLYLCMPVNQQPRPSPGLFICLKSDSADAFVLNNIMM